MVCVAIQSPAVTRPTTHSGRSLEKEPWTILRHLCSSEEEKTCFCSSCTYKAVMMKWAWWAKPAHGYTSCQHRPRALHPPPSPRGGQWLAVPPSTRDHGQAGLEDTWHRPLGPGCHFQPTCCLPHSNADLSHANKHQKISVRADPMLHEEFLLWEQGDHGFRLFGEQESWVPVACQGKPQVSTRQLGTISTHRGQTGRKLFCLKKLPIK